MQAVIISVAIFSPTAILLLIFTLMKRKNKPKQIDPVPPDTRLPPPPPPRKPRTETINDTTYILREHWWFQQYPVNDEITLELCVGHGVEWIEGLRPKRPYAGGGYSHDVRMKARKEGLTLEHAKEELDSMYASYCRNVDNHHQELQRLMDACCTTDTDRTRQIMESCCQSTESRINELHNDLRQQIIEQQMQARNAELFNRMVAVASPYYPVYPVQKTGGLYGQQWIQ